VSLRDRDGVYQDPSEAAQLVTTIEEFAPAPPPNIVRLSAAPRDVGYVVEWAPVHSPNLEYYEIRRGPQWHGAEVIARTRDNRLVVDDAPAGIPEGMDPREVQGRAIQPRARRRSTDGLASAGQHAARPGHVDVAIGSLRAQPMAAS
jgi:hypothetical protein